VGDQGEDGTVSTIPGTAENARRVGQEWA